MVLWSTTFALTVLTFYTAIYAQDTVISVVTYGSSIKLEHVATKHRLHSHDISYGTGSNQQSVTAVSNTADSNSFWVVKNAHETAPLKAGTTVNCGETLRLQHIRTKKNLHSHLHRAPLNRDYEVSAFGRTKGRWSEGDGGDNWVLECSNAKGPWKRDEDIRFRHIDTGYYLSSNPSLKFDHPIPGQQQVSSCSRKNANTVWKANEGFYIAPLEK